MKNEKHQRSIVKMISWRVTGTLLTILLAWLFTRNIAIALSIGGTEVVVKMVWYYAHERIWNNISWGYNHHR